MSQLPANSRRYTEDRKRRTRRFRREATVSERVTWELLMELGFKFRRQHAVGDYTLSFYCAEARLCVEVDGPCHEPERDARRDAHLVTLGLQTLRVPSLDLFEDIGVAKAVWEREIVRACEERSGRKVFEEPPPRHRRR